MTKEMSERGRSYDRKLARGALPHPWSCEIPVSHARSRCGPFPLQMPLRRAVHTGKFEKTADLKFEKKADLG